MKRTWRAALTSTALVLASGPAATQQSPDPLARADAPLRSLVQRHIANESKGDTGGTEVVGAEQADLDGDGKPEWVVLWTFLGPTYWWSRVSVFTQAGSTWRAAGTTAADGIVERLRVKGGEIHVDTMVAGPNDPRCCPSRKTVQRIRWQGGKLVSAKR
jgi:hypothetical protein